MGVSTHVALTLHGRMFAACLTLVYQSPAPPEVVISRLEAEADEMWRGAALGRAAMSSRDDHEKDGDHVLTRPTLRG